MPAAGHLLLCRFGSGLTDVGVDIALGRIPLSLGPFRPRALVGLGVGALLRAPCSFSGGLPPNSGS